MSFARVNRERFSEVEMWGRPGFANMEGRRSTIHLFCTYTHADEISTVAIPERNKDNANGQLSVLVVVHGSDYGWGAGNPYNASILAAYGQVVVVTLNYRLGVYGLQCPRALRTS